LVDHGLIAPATWDRRLEAPAAREANGEKDVRQFIKGASMNRLCLGLAGVVWVWASLAAAAWAATYAYIPGYAGNTVTRVATDDPEAAPLQVSLAGCGPYGAAVAPNGAFVLVTCMDNGTLAKITNANFDGVGSPEIIAVGGSPKGVAIEPRGRLAYVANHDEGTVSEISLMDNQLEVIDTIKVGDGPWGIAAMYDTEAQTPKVYVANHFDGTVSMITATGVVTFNVVVNSPLGSRPIGVAVTPDGQWVYVANQAPHPGNGTLAAIATSDNTVFPTLAAELGTWGVAAGAQGDFVYATNSVSNSVTVIRTSDQMVHGRFPVGPEPLGVAAPRNGNFAYVINGDDTISRINIETQVVDTISNVGIDGAYALGAFIGGTPPLRPTGFSGEGVADNRIELTWTDPATDAPGFKIERRTQGLESFFEIIQLPAGTTRYEDHGLASETTYEYRIRAFNEAADSAYTGPIEVTTEAGGFSWCFIGSLLR
jgi:YVTN family beta-propeller protein